MTMFLAAPLSALLLPLVAGQTSPAWGKEQTSPVLKERGGWEPRTLSLVITPTNEIPTRAPTVHQ